MAASLEYYDEFGKGVNAFRPVVSYFQQFMGIGPPAELSWQKEVRSHDLNGVGILGNSLDTIAFTAAAAQLNYVDPMTYVAIPNPLLQSKILAPCWRGEKDIFEMLMVLVRALASVGEIDLVEIDGEYDLFQINQRVSVDKKKNTITYRQRNDVKTTDTITVDRDNVHRCFVPQPGANHEAFAPTRRILPVLRLYVQIMEQFQRIAFSNSLMTKGVYLGEDDGDWERDEDYKSQFTDPSKAVPPIVNDMSHMAREIAEGGRMNPWWPMMGSIEPKAIDLTTSFDPEARQMLKDCNTEIGLGLNIPAQMLLGTKVTHFTEWLQDEQFRTYAVAPLLKIGLRFLDQHIYSKFATKAGYSAKLWYNFDELTATTLNPAQFVELFKIGAVGTKGIQRHLRLSPSDALLSAQDIELRKELLTGGQPAPNPGATTFPQRAAQKFGQDAQAVPPSNPVTTGNMRQGNENAKKSTVAASFDGVKKKI